MTILVAYASKHGSTEEIAHSIAEQIRAHGFEVDASPIAHVADVDDAEAVVVGSAVYGGSWMQEATAFVRHHAAALSRRPVWLFSSGPLGEHVQDEEDQPKQIAEFRDALRPRDHHVFMGALDPDKLGFAERTMIKAVQAPAGDYRDWDDVRAWADRIARELEE